jgi:putative ABC transport system permease protein
MITLPETRYADAQQQTHFFQQTLQAVRSLSGIESAGLATSLPFSGSRGTSTFAIDGRAMSANNGPEADRHQISPGYFHAMGIPLRAGRDFNDADSFSAQQVVVINEAAAKKFWPSESPLGKHITIGMPIEKEIYGKTVSREIVGIVGNVKHEQLTDDYHPEMYLPAWQLPSSNMTLVVRGHAGPASILAAVRRVLQSIDPEQPVRRVKLLEDAVSRSVTPQRFLTTLLMLFAGLALLLALIGTYGVMSFSVTQRYQEIGVRMALGATTADALLLVLRHGIRLALIGMMTGLILTLALTGVLRNLLFEVSATDPVTIIIVSAMLLIVTLAASLIPARRASRIDPLVAIRYE